MFSKPLARAAAAALLLLLSTSAWAQEAAAPAASPSIEDMLAEKPLLAETPAETLPGDPNAGVDASQSIAASLGSTPSVYTPAPIAQDQVTPASATFPPVAESGPAAPDFSAPSTDAGSTSADAAPDFAEMATSAGGAQSGKLAALGNMMGAMENSMDSKDSDDASKPDMFGNTPGDGGDAGGLMGNAMKNPIMTDLLKSVESKMPQNQALAAKAGVAPPISEQSKDIVAGIVETFMHKVALNPGEKECLDHNLATLTADVVGAVEDVVKAVKAIIAGRPGQGLGPEVRAKAQGTMVSAGLDGAMKLTSLVTLATTLMKNCVQGDALAMLRETGEHFINMQYIGERFLVSGVDIADRLADGIIAYEKKDWYRFGEDIGISLRKILMSNSTRGSALPEGVPEEAIIQETTEGLMSGFFAAGSGVEITDAAAPEVDIQLDLHRCISGNHEFFKEIWLAMWNLIAEIAVNPNQHGLEEIFSGKSADGSQPKWMGEIMVAMMQIPSALQLCNIDADAQAMMMKAIQSIKYLKVDFLWPQHVITADEATQRMAAAVKAWTNWDFKEFGKEIGKLLEEFVMLMYPREYSVYKNGRLQKQLARKSSVKIAGTFTPSFLVFIVGCAISSMFIGFAAVRSFRSMTRSQRDASSIEDGVVNGEFDDNLLEVE